MSTLDTATDAWDYAAHWLAARARDLGFGWYVAYWPHCSRAIFRIKHFERRAEWERRHWRSFGGEKPSIQDVSGAIWQLCAELRKPEAPSASGVLFFIDGKGKYGFTLSNESPLSHVRYFDITTTMCSYMLPIPRHLLPAWVKDKDGEFYPPSAAPDPDPPA